MCSILYGRFVADLFRNDVVAEAARLRNTIDSYEAKSEHDLKRLEEEMRTLLETKHSEAMSRIGELEVGLVDGFTRIHC